MSYYNISLITKWYNDCSAFYNATGINTPVTEGYIRELLSGAKSSENIFFSLAYLVENSVKIGFLRGSLHEKNNIAWINILAVEPDKRSKGYGGKILNLLTDYLNRHFYTKKFLVSVMEKNIRGMEFWIKNGFCNAGHIQKKHEELYGIIDAVIMSKEQNDDFSSLNVR